MKKYNNNEVLNIDIKNEPLEGWLVNNKHVIIPELIAGAEKILYDSLDEPLPLVKITGNSVTEMLGQLANSKFTKKVKPPINKKENTKGESEETNPYFLIALHKDEIKQMLETSMEWCLKTEEYELCHRIKLLQNKINDTEK